MGRNRRMPPLFEVMRQTNPGPPPGQPAPASTPASGQRPPADPVRNQAFFRAPSQPERPTGAALRLAADTDADTNAPTPAPTPTPAPAAAPVPPVSKPVEVRVGQARRNWVVEDTAAKREDDATDDAGGSGSGSARPPAGLPVPGMWLAVGAAAVLTLIVLIWVVAYRQGSSAKEQEFQGKLSTSAPTGPSAKPGTGTPGTGANPAGSGQPPVTPPEHRPAREPEPPAPQPKPTNLPAPVPPKPAAVDPAPATDPRQAETNYLSVLTYRSKEDAVELASFLTAGGLPAATVPLKASGGGSVGWEVFVLQGIPSADFRRADDTRNAIHRKLEDLGRKWNQDGRSRLNLARDNVTWRKFKPGS